MRILIVAATAPEIEPLTTNMRFAIYDCDQGANITAEKKETLNKLYIKEPDAVVGTATVTLFPVVVVTVCVAPPLILYVKV